MFWKKKKKQDVRAQATEILTTKRAEIGEETLDEIRSAIMARQNSKLEQAKRKIMQTDDEKLRDNIKFLLDDK